MRLLKWEELVWVIVSIPKTEAELMIKVAAKHNLRPVNGTPHMFSKNETKSFPIEDTDNTFVLENIVSPDSIINLKEITGILTREEIAMEEIFEETKKRIEQDKKNKKSG